MMLDMHKNHTINLETEKQAEKFDSIWHMPTSLTSEVFNIYIEITAKLLFMYTTIPLFINLLNIRYHHIHPYGEHSHHTEIMEYTGCFTTCGH